MTGGIDQLRNQRTPRANGKATAGIDERIEGIQTSPAGIIPDDEQAPRVISAVNEIVSTITMAMETQSMTLKEITSNVSQSSQGIREVMEKGTWVRYWPERLRWIFQH